MFLTLRALAVVVIGCALATAAQAARVAVLSNTLANETAADFNTKIPAHTFTGFDVSASLPDLSTLVENFDVILLYEDNRFAGSSDVGNRVAAFANAGHAVVLGTFYDQDRSDAAGGGISPHGWGALEAIDPNTTDGIGTAYAVRTLSSNGLITHPLTRGVTSLSALRGDPGPYAGGNQAKQGTQVVALWAQLNAKGNPDPAIAYRVTGSACVIHIGIAPDYGVLPKFGTYGTDFAGDFYRAWGNAFDFGASGCRSSIPTLSQWTTFALALLLVMSGGVLLREARRPRTPPL